MGKLLKYFESAKGWLGRSISDSKGWFGKWWFSLLCVVVAVGQTLDLLKVEWTTIALVGIAGLPTLVPLIARSVAVIRKTKDGWEFEMRQDLQGLPGAVIDGSFIARFGTPNVEVMEPKTLPDGKSFDLYSLNARRVLAALWYYQKKTFPEKSDRRWGFVVGQLAKDYEAFALGRDQLKNDGLVFQAEQGLIYLTAEGVSYCEQHHKEIENEPIIYKDFVAAK